ncbi:Cytochrome P450 [Duganella sp. CF458]|uniref:cytochrome P450 n=1 Tax=Duganella sp. CF458 TaxID=1884368 RepID=UPI0008E6FD41|nr:cytochrome P450 [Duganella sp. CF458]SFG03757.1 Cytochrome P450 [Duganella sp. CF458]
MKNLEWDAGRGWWVADSAVLVEQVLSHPALRVRPLAEPVPAAIAGGCAGQVFGALVRMNDGERHIAPKLALQRALAVSAAGDAARQRAHTVAAHLLAEGRSIGAWAFEAPVATVASLLGFADEQLPAVARWMGDFVACLSPLSSAEQIEQAHAASLRLLAAMRELLQAAPQDSLAASVAQEAAAAGWRNDHAILANLVGLLSQTYEATAGLLGNSLVAIQQGAASVDAGALVAHVMATDPPIINTRRFAAERCAVGGVTVEAGQAILVMLGAAKRGFGHGRHACPGQQLAQQIAAGCIEALRSKPLPQLTWTYRASVNARIPEFHQ